MTKCKFCHEPLTDALSGRARQRTDLPAEFENWKRHATRFYRAGLLRLLHRR